MGSDKGGVFWREVYWFTIIALVSITVALLVLPPKAVEYRSLSLMEAEPVRWTHRGACICICMDVYTYMYA